MLEMQISSARNYFGCQSIAGRDAQTVPIRNIWDRDVEVEGVDVDEVAVPAALTVGQSVFGKDKFR